MHAAQAAVKNTSLKMLLSDTAFPPENKCGCKVKSVKDNLQFKVKRRNPFLFFFFS